MRRLVATALVLSVCAAASTAHACAFHGRNGGFHWSPTSGWQGFSTGDSYVDLSPSYSELDTVDPLAFVPPERVRPMFSNAASKAARAAVAMRLMKAKDAPEADSETPLEDNARPAMEATPVTASEPDAQPVREAAP